LLRRVTPRLPLRLRLAPCLFFLLVDTALIVLSSLAGARLIVAGAKPLLEISPSAEAVFVIVLAGSGS
jgi:hypothetical protein